MKDIKEAILHLKFKVWQYQGQHSFDDEEDEFVKEHFHIYSSDWQFIEDEEGHLGELAPLVNTTNQGRVFLQKGDYLLYVDSDNPFLGNIDPILIRPNDFSVDFDYEHDLSMEDLLENDTLTIVSEKEQKKE